VKQNMLNRIIEQFILNILLVRSGVHLMSLLWPFIRLLNGCTISSAYWHPHIPHSKR